jgi:hypothetical protein
VSFFFRSLVRLNARLNLDRTALSTELWLWLWLSGSGSGTMSGTGTGPALETGDWGALCAGSLYYPLGVLLGTGSKREEREEKKSQKFAKAPLAPRSSLLPHLDPAAAAAAGAAWGAASSRARKYPRTAKAKRRNAFGAMKGEGEYSQSAPNVKWPSTQQSRSPGRSPGFAASDAR